MNVNEIVFFLKTVKVSHSDITRIHCALKNAYERFNRTAVNQHHVDQRVSWATRSGWTQTGVITQINKTTATAREDVTDKLWRIPAGMLRPYVKPE